MTHNGHLTAIARKAPSQPMRYLYASGRLQGRMLDYGCGRGTDAEAFGMEGFDPFHRPELPAGPFDTVTCNYVLNVIPSEAERRAVLDSVLALLAPGGVAYVSVRNDTRSLNGWTSKGTWQGDVGVPGATLLRSTSAFRLYELRKDFA
jgi:ATP adenylyltransferase